MDGTGEPAARRRTLLGDAERDQFVAVLREHYAAGRLSLEELRRRAGIVLAAAYRDEAEAALAELPVTAADTAPATAADTAPANTAPGNTGPGTRRGWPSRRHAQTAAPAAGWVSTAERFRDPSSGVIMRVWVDPADGSRHYVPDDATAG